MKSIYESTFDIIKADENLKSETVQRMLRAKSNLRPSKESDKPAAAPSASKPKKNRKLPWIITAASTAAVLLFLGIFLPLSGLFGGGDYTKDGKLIPQYLGMKAGMTSIAPENKTAAQISDIDRSPHFMDRVNDDEESEVDDYDPFPQDGQGAYIAYTGVDFFVTVFLNNPDNFEILSFTLNGKHYQSYEFQPGSDGRNIILKCKAEPAVGVYNYTIDAIKYVEGTAIKDVRIKGSKTIKISVLEKDWQETPGLQYTLINNGTEYAVSAGSNAQTTVFIPRFYNDKPVTEIAERGFEQKRIYDITIPGSVRVIRRQAFAASNLSRVTFSEGLEAIEDQAFYGCGEIWDITLPASLKSIGREVLRCTSLRTITVQDGNAYFKSVGGILFSKDGGTLIKYPQGRTDSAYNIPTGVTRIAPNAFDSSRSIQELIIPEGVTAIESCAFRYTTFTHIVIPLSVTEIGDEAFRSYDLRTVMMLRPSFMGVAKLGTFMVFEYSVPGDCMLTDIFVPDAASVTAYRTAANWSQYAGFIQVKP